MWFSKLASLPPPKNKQTNKQTKQNNNENNKIFTYIKQKYKMQAKISECLNYM